MTAYDGSGKVPIQAFPFALGLGCVCLESDSHHPISQSSDSHTVISAAASQRTKYPQPVMPLFAVAYFPPDSDLSTTTLFASASPAMWNIVMYIMIWYFPHASECGMLIAFDAREGKEPIPGNLEKIYLRMSG